MTRETHHPITSADKCFNIFWKKTTPKNMLKADSLATVVIGMLRISQAILARLGKRGQLFFFVFTYSWILGFGLGLREWGFEFVFLGFFLKKKAGLACQPTRPTLVHPRVD